MKKERIVSPPEAWAPPRWDLADVSAIQALAAGTASEDQQKRALKWIVERAAGTYDLEYRTDPRDHAFVSGKRNVGLNIITMLQFDIAKLKQAVDGKHR